MLGNPADLNNDDLAYFLKNGALTDFLFSRESFANMAKMMANGWEKIAKDIVNERISNDDLVDAIFHIYGETLEFRDFFLHFRRWQIAIEEAKRRDMEPRFEGTKWVIK